MTLIVLLRFFEKTCLINGGVALNYQSLIAIMDQGESNKAIEAVNKSGQHSGTLLKGRGSGLHEKQKILSVALEPEKDILLLVTPEEKAEEIVGHIDDAIKIREPGNGVLVGMRVNRVHGI